MDRIFVVWVTCHIHEPQYPPGFIDHLHESMGLVEYYLETDPDPITIMVLLESTGVTL